MSRVPPWLLRIARPLVPGWPDAGRRIVQGPAIGDLLAETTRARQPHVVLNAGCGEGLFAPLLLSTCGADLQIEMDLSPAGARHLRSSRQRYLCGSLTHVPLCSGSVDLVLCSEVLEHIPDDAAATAEIARVLKPGGWLVISVPTPPALPDPNHVREGYPPAALERLLAARDLIAVRSLTCMRFFFRTLLRWWRPGLFPLVAITALARLDRLLPLGRPMDLVLLARKGGNQARVEPSIQAR